MFKIIKQIYLKFENFFEVISKNERKKFNTYKYFPRVKRLS